MKRVCAYPCHLTGSRIGLPIIHYIPYLQYSDKKQSSQTCEPQPCELLIVYCKSDTEPSQGVWSLHAKLEF